MTAHMPINEAERIRALESYNILDTGEDENFERIVRMARTALDTPIGLISFVDRKRQWFKTHQGMAAMETPRAVSFCAHAILDDNVMVVEDATKDERFADNPLVTCENGIRFYAGAPLIAPDGHRLGTLCLIDSVPRHIDDRGKNLLKDMAAQVVAEMELRKIAGVDPLTGLYTRRMIDEMARREFARGIRQSQPITYALLDADKFKSVNDRFGHTAGDAVLRTLGATVAPIMRAHDHLGRFGGEEFLVVLPNTPLNRALPVLERMRKTVEGLKIPELNGDGVSVSIGAAELSPQDASFEKILARADAALYRAKASGRNRVECESES